MSNRSITSVVAFSILMLSTFGVAPSHAREASARSVSRSSQRDTKVFFSACPDLTLTEECPSDTTELFSMSPDGSQVVQLTHDDGFNRYVVASSDGRRLATSVEPPTEDGSFSWSCDEGAYLEVIDFDGSHPAPLTTGRWECDEPIDWSVAGKPILFERSLILGANAKSIDPETLKETAFTRYGEESDRYAGSPHWIDQGRHVAFAKRERKHYHIFVCRPDGSKMHRLWRDEPFVSEGGFELSPDGTKLMVFGSTRHVPYGVFIVDRDGDHPVSLRAPGNLDVIEPVWSPDGRRIAFVGIDPDGAFSYLFTANSDGSDVRRIGATSALVDRVWQPTWSPDGVSIAFLGEQFRTTMDGYLLEAVFTVDADGANEKQVSAWDPFAQLWGWLPTP